MAAWDHVVHERRGGSTQVPIYAPYFHSELRWASRLRCTGLSAEALA